MWYREHQRKGPRLVRGPFCCTLGSGVAAYASVTYRVSWSRLGTSRFSSARASRILPWKYAVLQCRVTFGMANYIMTHFCTVTSHNAHNNPYCHSAEFRCRGDFITQIVAGERVETL